MTSDERKLVTRHFLVRVGPFFNVFNQVNFDIPNRAVNNLATLGRITRTEPSSGIHGFCSFGLKLVF